MLAVASLSSRTGAPAGAAAIEPVCKVHSAYDLTVASGALTFERTAAEGQRIEMRKGQLSVNGATVMLPDSDRRRIASYEAKVRALIPRIKALGQRAVDLGAAALREEAANVTARASQKLNARVESRARDLKLRIANSTTTKEWRGAALDRYSAELVADILPLVAAELAQQALEVAVKGDLAGAAALQKRALGLRASLEARIRERLKSLEPEVARLCPSARELDILESAITGRLPDGSRLNLIDVRTPQAGRDQTG